MNAFVDQDACIGCGMCTGVAPEVFAMNADGKAEATASGDGFEAAVQDAIDSCPVGAIRAEK